MLIRCNYWGRGTFKGCQDSKPNFWRLSKTGRGQRTIKEESKSFEGGNDSSLRQDFINKRNYLRNKSLDIKTRTFKKFYKCGLYEHGISRAEKNKMLRSSLTFVQRMQEIRSLWDHVSQKQISWEYNRTTGIQGWRNRLIWRDFLIQETLELLKFTAWRQWW